MKFLVIFPLAILLLFFLPQTSFQEMPPLKQSVSDLHEIHCKDSLKLLFKMDLSPVCVKPTSWEKLVERGWGLDHIPIHMK